MSTHILLLLLAGIALMGTFMLPGLLRKQILSLPIIYVTFGFAVFSLPIDLPLMNPEDARFDRQLMEYITEFIVIISLAGTGLKMKRDPGWKTWSTGIYLLAIAMPLTILAVAGLGWWWVGLAPASAILLGAVLAPTDPVLAANVQVGPPQDDSSEDEVRFGLTLEAGLNDGLAFPFVYLAIAIVSATDISDAVLTWAWWDFGYRIIVGTVCGWAMGKSLAWLFAKFEAKMTEREDTEIEEGFFILAATLLTYSLTEIVEGYGFLAVFVAAVISGRTSGAKVETRQQSYEAIDQVEQAVLGIFLIAFGGITATGGLADLTWEGALLGLAILLIIRPLSGMIAFIPSKLPFLERLAISYFGIRGVGSLYYLAYAHNSEYFPEIDAVWSIVNFTMLVSIFLHGLSVKPFLSYVDRRMGREKEAE
ncbi:cation:proton antiporter [Neolewinella antarctica]|uniref:NhaP-type Na+/H+ or K+/H+ antiporter n=1 Tax=Neolewinella antarctica TaxID=442734 RepID=A0ABX0X605_9BACT|nr:cation:proton antiporter [Neolewinella antarctica]NJC24612.1 NhaP-type Na+/H+ or K+/H+ antiporter [Neolewinella antarctica]